MGTSFHLFEGGPLDISPGGCLSRGLLLGRPLSISPMGTSPNGDLLSSLQGGPLATSPKGGPVSQGDLFQADNPCPHLPFRCLQMGDLLCFLPRGYLQQGSFSAPPNGTLWPLSGVISKWGSSFYFFMGPSSKGILYKKDLYLPLPGDPL